MGKRAAARAGDKNATSLHLKPADPFELIRWLARSQSDPRKAVCELVQNSLDAKARTVEIRRQRIKGQLCLVLRDDGEGVLPSEGREDALRYLATHVGHSRKLGLDPAERAKHVVAGKYGVGLLGFWSIGRHMEIRTRVGGSGILALRMTEDRREAQILAMPGRIGAAETFTEVVVFDVHPAAQKALGGRRLADFLSAELRGQLLRREVSIVVHDDVARGLAQKVFPVVPRRFAGERLDVPAEIEVPGHPPLRIELYLARGAEQPAVQVACAGTLVADDVTELATLGLDVEPWTGRELVGLLDFPALNVPPGTRRGVVPDRFAEAFVEALSRLEPLVVAELVRLDAERKAAVDRHIVRDLRRALRGMGRRLPRYDLPRVRDEGEIDGAGAAEPASDSGENYEAGEGAVLDDTEPEVHASPGEELPLFPPGPLAEVRILPADAKVAPGHERRVRASVLDADGRALSDAVDVVWSLTDPSGALTLDGKRGARAAVRAAPDAVLGTAAELRVEARQGERVACSAATVVVAEAPDAAADFGIPEPVLVSDAEGSWRSRMRGETWEVNDAHEDYRALRGEGRARIRYMLALIAKEIVLRTAGGDARDGEMLEDLVEVLAHAERNLRGS